MNSKTYQSNMMVNGRTILSVVDGMGAFKQMAKNILSDAGLPPDIRPEGWYPQDQWLKAFKEIYRKIGKNTLKMIGKQIPEHAQFPPGIKNIEEGLRSIDIAYHMNHADDKGLLFDEKTGKMREGIGHYLIEKVEPKRIIMKCDNPYPCAFDIGIIEAIARKFINTVKVEHFDNNCRNNGDPFCRYSITWF